MNCTSAAVLLFSGALTCACGKYVAAESNMCMWQEYVAAASNMCMWQEYVAAASKMCCGKSGSGV